jgi:hypothetical protein
VRCWGAADSLFLFSHILKLLLYFSLKSATISLELKSFYRTDYRTEKKTLSLGKKHMRTYVAELYNLPSFLCFIIWVFFPVWFAMRRRQGLIKIERWDSEEGSKNRMGDYFEVGIFVFAIPFTFFFLLVTANFIMSFFIDEASVRLRASFETTSLIMDIALTLYMYLAERKIHLDRIKKNKY